MAMKWNKFKDILLAREVYSTRPYHFKKGTADSGGAWESVANTLNEIKDGGFTVNKKSVQDHFKLIYDKFEKAQKGEEKVTGGGDVHVDELTVLLEEIKTDMESCQTLLLDAKENEKAKEDADKAKGEEVRNVAMESFAETKKRGDEENMKSPPGKKRRMASDTHSFLAEKNERLMKIEEEKLNFSREELEVRRIEAQTAAKNAESSAKTQEGMLKNMQETQAQNAQTNRMMLQFMQKFMDKI